MACSREHVHCRDLLQLVAILGEAQDIARECGGVAGDVDHALRIHRRDSRDGLRAHALARRVDHNGVWPQAARGKLRRRIARVATDEAGVPDSVHFRVVPRVFYCLRYNLRADHPFRLPGKTQAYRTRAAVEVEHQLRGLLEAVFAGTLIEPLGLRGIDLEKRLRCDVEAAAAQRIAHIGSAVQRVKITGQHGVSASLIDIQHDPRQLWAVAAEPVHKRLSVRTETLGRDYADHGVRAAHRAAAEHMAHRAASGLLVVGRYTALVYEVDDGLRRPVAQLVLGEAAVDSNEPVTARLIEAEARRPVTVGDGENALVAIIISRGAAENLGTFKLLLADMVQRAVDAAELEAQLLFVIYMTAVTAAAAGIVRAVRLDALRRCGDEPLTARVYGCRRDLDELYFPLLAGYRAGDEHGSSADAADSAAVR